MLKCVFLSQEKEQKKEKERSDKKKENVQKKVGKLSLPQGHRCIGVLGEGQPRRGR